MRFLFVLISSLALAQLPKYPLPIAASTGGNVGGASSLTTVGAIPRVSAAGILGQSGATDDGTTFSIARNLTLPDPGTSANSYSLSLVADNAGTTQTASAQVIYCATPYLKIAGPDGAAASYVSVWGNVASVLTEYARFGTTMPCEVLSNASGNAMLLRGRDNSTLDEGALYFRHNDGSTAHGALIGDSSTLQLFGATTLVLTLDSSGVKLAGNTETACDLANRFRLIPVAGGAGVADTFRICSKDAADAYAFRALY